MKKALRDPKQHDFQLREALLDVAGALTRLHPDTAVARARAGEVLACVRSLGR